MSTMLERIDSFAELEPDWAEGGAEKISPHAIERAKIFASVLAASSPVVFPTPDGGVSFEWSNHLGHVSIDFYPEEMKSPDLLHGDVFVMHVAER